MAGTAARHEPDTALAEGLPAADESAWLAVVERALRDKPFDSLKSTTRDGIGIDPIYAAGTVKGALAMRAGGQPWTVMQRLDLPDADAANRQALDDLSNGASGLALVPNGSRVARGAGLSMVPDHLSAALDGVQADMIDLRVEPSAPSAEDLKGIADVLLATGHDAAALRVSFGIDPIGSMACAGGLAESEADTRAGLARQIGDLQARGFSGPFIELDGRVWHDAGASDGQELAATLATLVHYLRWLEAEGADLDKTPAWFGATLSADADQFATIAKFRALRLLWQRVLETSGLPFRPLRLHGETAWRMMTRRDPHTNLLRTTIAAFSAGIGGVDSVTVLPHSAALGLPDSLSRRIARNTQLILIEESGLARVADPVAGAGFPEYLTRALAETAWRLFQEIEREGGIIASLKAGALQARIAKIAADRNADIAAGREAIVGTSAFPPQAGFPTAGDILDLQVVATADNFGNLDVAEPCEMLAARRLAEPFERLLEDAERHAAEHGSPLSVLVATLGDRASFSARLAWLKNVLSAGGIAVETTEPLETAEALSAVLAGVGGQCVILCGADPTYDMLAPDIQEHSARLAFAGKPRPALSDLNVAIYLHQGMDLVEGLRVVQRLAGLEAT